MSSYVLYMNRQTGWKIDVTISICFFRLYSYFMWSCIFLWMKKRVKLNISTANKWKSLLSNYCQILFIIWKKKFCDKMADLPAAIFEEKWLWWPPFLLYRYNRHTSMFSILVVLRSAQFKGHTWNLAEWLSCSSDFLHHLILVFYNVTLLSWSSKWVINI